MRSCCSCWPRLPWRRPRRPPRLPAARISFMVFGDPAEKAAYERLVADFTRHHPDIQVSLIHIPEPGRLPQAAGRRLRRPARPPTSCCSTTAATAPSPPRACSSRSGPTSSAAASSSEADFYPQALEPFRWQGTLMCIPQNLSSLVVYYNRELFDRAGRAYAHRRLDLGRLPARRAGAHADTKGDRADRPVRARHRGLDLPPGAVRLAERRRARRRPAAPDAADARRAAQRAKPCSGSSTCRSSTTWCPTAVEEKAESSEQPLPERPPRHVPQQPARRADLPEITTLRLGRGAAAAGAASAPASCTPTPTACRRPAANKAAAWTFIEFANSAEGQTDHRGVRAHGALAEARSPSRRPFSIPAPSRRTAGCSSTESRSSAAVPVTEGWVDVEDLAGEELARGVLRPGRHRRGDRHHHPAGRPLLQGRGPTPVAGARAQVGASGARRRPYT